MRGSQGGFSLLELLVVAAIIGILAALALPNYALFKINALNSSAANDARNIAPAAELVASGSSPDQDVILTGVGGPIPELPGATTSPGVVGLVTVRANSYTIEVENLGGTLRYRLDSTTGWSVTEGS